jgi:hypothetical protein
MEEFIPTNSGSIYLALRSSSNLTEQAVAFTTTIADWGEKMAVLKQYSACNDAIGNYISLRQDLAFCPALIGPDDRIVFLFQFVEMLDGLIDYENVQRLLPGFSFKQIGGAIAFLRKLAQFNLNGIDIDTFIDSEDTADVELINNLRSTLPIRETSLVLNIP